MLSEDKTFYAYNIILEGFNTVIENMGGECMFDHACFRNNKMDYLVDRDWGAAILNAGLCICNQCSFENNYAKNGGAIFNQGILILDNCTFAGNEAYGKGDDVCSANGGTVLLDGVEIKESTAHVTCVESISSGWQTVIKISAFVLSFAIGFAAGFFTANIAIGAVVGALAGAGIGVGASAIIFAYSYDVHQDRWAIAIGLTIGCSISGLVGGFIGGAISPFGPAQFVVDQQAAAGFRPEVAEFLEDSGMGYFAPVEDAADFSESFSVISESLG